MIDITLSTSVNSQNCRKFTCESYNNETNTKLEEADKILHCLQESSKLKRSGIVDAYQDFCHVENPDVTSSTC